MLTSSRNFLGDENYFVNTLGFTNTLDMRESPFVTPRGFLINNTLDLASSAFGSDIEFIRGTIRTGYYLPFGPKPLTPGVVEDKPGLRFSAGSNNPRSLSVLVPALSTR
jgi:outer membrane protein assembly factor BamA